MIAIKFCLRRLPGLSPDQFQAYWFDQHAPLVCSVASALGIRRYVQSHALSDADFAWASSVRGSEFAPYDGIAELWYDSADAIKAAGATEAGRAAGRLLLADERRFIDLPHSPIFLVREHCIIGEPSGC